MRGPKDKYRATSRINLAYNSRRGAAETNFSLTVSPASSTASAAKLSLLVVRIHLLMVFRAHSLDPGDSMKTPSCGLSDSFQ